MYKSGTHLLHLGQRCDCVYYLGDKFDLKEFHDAVLLESAVPMSILEKLVDQYINSHK